MTVISRPVRMPRFAFLVSWELAGLGELPVVIGPGQSGWNNRRRALEVLVRLGLAGDDGVLEPRYRRTLGVLGNARREVFSWDSLDREVGSAAGVLSAVSGADAVRLIAGGETVRLDPVRPAELAASVVDALPTCSPARVRPMGVPKDRRGVGRDCGGGDLLAELAEKSGEFRLVLREKPDAVHQFRAAGRGFGGERTWSAPGCLVDLAGRGRLLVVVSGDDRRITVFPGRRAHVTAVLGHLVDTLG
ncbi:ESX secretion-associated protein EspG [Amycolatopsis sp. WGS_07]|uniref:ESX secretion-associated protein EspG n=1 Tax=Amycolatopsis sp. WGS_07 TaxID=3076764 RepID=UPI003873C532